MLFNPRFSEGGHSAFPTEDWESCWTPCLGWSDPSNLDPLSSSLRASLIFLSFDFPSSHDCLLPALPLNLFVPVTPTFGFREI